MANVIVADFDSRTKDCSGVGPETWKPVPGWTGYEVSDLGRVRSFKKRGSNGGLRETWRLLALKFNKKTGHLRATLSDRDRRKDWTLQGLVLTVFVGPRPEGMEACHGNGKAVDCRLANLRWDTSKGNCWDRIRHGTHGKQRLKAKDIPTIRGMLEARYPVRFIAKQYGVGTSTIDSIRCGATWASVKGCEPLPQYSGSRSKPGPKPRPKLTVKPPRHEFRSTNRERRIPKPPLPSEEFRISLDQAVFLLRPDQAAFLLACFFERWAEPPGLEGYRISTWGRFQSRRSTRSDKLRPAWKAKKWTILKNGYPIVSTSSEGKTALHLVHHLVLETFVGPRPPGEEARHVPDNNPLNACLWNLAWGTPVENAADKKQNGTCNEGSRHGMSKLTESEVRAIRQKSLDGQSKSSLAGEYGVAYETIKGICSRKRWRHVE